MKKAGKYRFSLQFGASSEAQLRAGGLLERLGNRKSAVVVTALNEYIAAHPELDLSGEQRIHIKLETGYSREAIEKLVRQLIDERLSQAAAPAQRKAAAADTSGLNGDIAEMLCNLEVFDA